MNISQKTFNRIVIAAVILGFIAVVGAAIAAGWTVARNQQHSSWVSHTYEVESAISNFRVTMERAEVARRGYLLSSDDRFYQLNAKELAKIPKQIDRLGELVSDNDDQLGRVEEIERLLTAYFNLRERRGGARAIDGATFYSDSAARLVREIREIADIMAAEETKLLNKRNAEQAAGVRALYGVMAVAGILLAFVGIGSIIIILRFIRDLNASRGELEALNEGLEDAVKERTADLQRANEEIQRFAYIVSHDLRSPLVNVMGFTAELDASLGDLNRCIAEIETQTTGPAVETAKLAISQDLPEAIGFIRTSTQKMDRLINAILRLSREGRRILAPERLNMSTVLSGVADSLRQRAEQVGAAITLEEPLPDIVSDRTAIEQVFSNLVENAVKYGKPGRPVRVVVRGHVATGRVVFEVQDNGRGIDRKDHERIFELFRRSGVQDVSGEGIGLAHVRALVYRLGGWISCESELDQGAIFRVSLPATLTPETAGD